MRRIRVLVMTSSLLVPLAAGAQPAPAPAQDLATDKARELHIEAEEAYKRGEYAVAEVAFRAAWGLKPHWQIAGGLGDCEFRAGKMRDAAEHLTFFLREAPADKPPPGVDRAKESLKEALGKIGTVTVRVDVLAAELSVDGKLLGNSPLVDPVFVDPGKHDIEAKLFGYPTVRKTIEIGAGGTEDVTLDLEGAKRDSAAPPPADPVPKENVKPGGGVRYGIVAAGLGVTVAGAVAGGVFLFLSSSKSTDRSNAIAALGGPSPCGAGTSNTAQCSAISDDSQAQNTFQGVAIGSFAVAGAALLATGAYALFTPSGHKADKAGKATAARFLPATDGRTSSLNLLGQF